MNKPSPGPWLRLPGRVHFWGSLLIVLFTVVVMASQITDRSGFANGDLHRDVMERWGAPIYQTAPSVRWVESGSVFNTLHPLPLDRQQITFDAEMNYRKRGLIYFSGFDFSFRSSYTITNPRMHDIDVVFVFPVHVEKNRILLSDRSFLVDGQPEEIEFDGEDKLVWTSRLGSGESVDLELAFKGRGLDLFSYHLDPALPVHGFSLDVNIRGGDNYDYAPGVVPAHSVEVTGDQVRLSWDFASLESGVPVGVILPSESSFDSIILTMIRRSVTTFALFFVVLVAISFSVGRVLARHESYLLASTYAFFYVLLPYLAAYMHFYAAYVLTLLAISGLIQFYGERIFSRAARWPLAGAIGSLLFLPTLAIIMQNYTGLIYSLEILAGLALLIVFTTRSAFRSMLEHVDSTVSLREKPHAS